MHCECTLLPLLPWFLGLPQALWDDCDDLCAGKTGLAVGLARLYGASCLSIDSVVQEAVSSGASAAALQARQLCGMAITEPMKGSAEENGEGC